MKVDLGSIKNPQVRVFYMLYWPQHQVIIDFYTRLPAEQFDFRMVERSDSPRRSLAHILYVILVYMNAVKTGKLEFKSMGTEEYQRMPKEWLMAELERVDQEMYAFLTAEGFSDSSLVETPWGAKMGAVDLLFFLRDHDILHIGWNLALMDHLGMPRFESLIGYWG
jgi:uncharacterized damage-inducible protein DinB